MEGMVVEKLENQYLFYLTQDIKNKLISCF